LLQYRIFLTVIKILRTGSEKWMWEGEGDVISENKNNGGERERLLFIKLIKQSIKAFHINVKDPTPTKMITVPKEQLLCKI
jgi:hypothetical protein